MRINQIFIWMLLLNGCFASNLSAQISSIYGDFPYERNLMDGRSAAPDISFPTSQKPGTNPNRARFINDLGLQLTPDSTYSFGAVFVDRRQFSSVVGIKIEFEYMMYDGTGGDGLSMFLFDAAVNDPQIGAHGAGIGYAYNRSYKYSLEIPNEGMVDFSKYRSKGLSGAYLGVAFDEYGNYKGLRFQGESRVSGIPYTGTVQGTTPGMKDGRYNGGDQITLRGARGPIIDESLGLGDGYTGYPVLITQAINNTDVVNNTQDRPGFQLDGSVREIKYNQISTYKGNLFSISGGKKFVNSDDPAYRKATVELFPAPLVNNKSDGFLISVSIQHGQTTDVVISDYHYKESFWYSENAYPNGGNGDNNSTDIVRITPVYRELDASIPDFLRVGFAASTGEKTNRHVIKNLKISLPRAAEANNDIAETNQGVSISIMPLENDIAYDGQIQKIQEGKPEYLDVSTFRFRDADGSIISGNSYTDNDGNIWTFVEEDASSPLDRTIRVTLTPHPTFFGEAKIDYDILGGRYQADPYGDPAYRSLPATITVNVLKSAIVYRNTISNKMVTTKLK